MDKNEVLLDSYALQKDLRIRLPKQVLSNLPVDVGSVFNIYFNPATHDVILRVSKSFETAESNLDTEENKK